VGPLTGGTIVPPDSVPVVPFVGDRPQSLAGLEISPPDEYGRSVVYDPATERYLRLAPASVLLLRALDGTKTVADLVAGTGRPEIEPRLRAGVESLRATGLLLDQAAPVQAGLGRVGLDQSAVDSAAVAQPVSARRRFRVVPPLTVQIDLFTPQQVLGPLVWLVRVLSGRVGRAALGVVLLAGAVSLAEQAPLLRSFADQPTNLRVVLLVVLLIVTVTAVHELMHGAVLVHGGGTPRRIGFVLLYGMPAFYALSASSSAATAPGRERMGVRASQRRARGCTTQ